MNRFKSRKFWLAVGTVFSIAIAEAFGVDVDPATIAGIVLTVSVYIFGQGLVDKNVVTAQVLAGANEGKALLEQYVRSLEVQLTEVTASLERANFPFAELNTEANVVPQSPVDIGGGSNLEPTNKAHAEE